MLIGVAVAIPEPLASEVTGWRLRFGDPQALSIPAHITLVPPIAVDDLDAVEAHLRAVSERSPAFGVRLHGTGTFRPLSPVVFLSLIGGISGCEALQRRLRSGPLTMELNFPYHPHVTVAHHLPDEVLDEAFTTLAEFDASFLADRFDLFVHREDRWETRGTFPLVSSR